MCGLDRMQGFWIFRFNFLSVDMTCFTIWYYSMRERTFELPSGVCANGLRGCVRKMLQAVLPLFAVISCDKHVPQEETGPVYTDEDIELDARIVDYINTSYASSITEVRVTEDKVSVSGNYVGKGDFYVAEISPVQDLLCLEEPLSKHIPGADSFTFEVDRFVRAGGVTYDRLLSKWAIFEVSSDGAHLVSAAHYADIVPALSSPAKLTLKNKKGMGGIFNNSFISDFDELGLGSATLNMYVTAFTYLSPGPGRIEHEYGGRKYYFDENYVVNNLDAMLLEAGKRNMLVAAILLVQPASAAVDRELGELLAHDGFTGGNLTLPDMTKPESVNCFAAITDFLVQRYTREDGKYGRVAHWIVMNEVDGATSWANIGPKPQNVFTDYYIKILRLVNNIVRQYDQNAETFASFTHSWTLPALDYPAKGMIEMINVMGKKEGDFRWALAYHSYPWDLLNPRCWECPYSTFSMDTQGITFRNLEVMDKWIKMPENMYRGTQKRSVWLSEAGLNSRSHSEADLKEQAAGTAFAWKKVNALDGIDGIQWHNWFDNAGDGSGALLGLRKFNDSEYNGEPKEAWNVYKAAGTDREDEVFDRYLDYLGYESWDEIFVTDIIK